MYSTYANVGRYIHSRKVLYINQLQPTSTNWPQIAARTDQNSTFPHSFTRTTKYYYKSTTTTNLPHSGFANVSVISIRTDRKNVLVHERIMMVIWGGGRGRAEGFTLCGGGRAQLEKCCAFWKCSGECRDVLDMVIWGNVDYIKY